MIKNCKLKYWVIWQKEKYKEELGDLEGDNRDQILKELLKMHNLLKESHSKIEWRQEWWIKRKLEIHLDRMTLVDNLRELGLELLLPDKEQTKLHQRT